MDELLRAGFAALGLPLDAAALARFQTYYTLLDERSKVMNLTAIHGETDVAQLHFLDSAALLTVEPLAGKSVIDVGTRRGLSRPAAEDRAAGHLAHAARQSR